MSMDLILPVISSILIETLIVLDPTQKHVAVVCGTKCVSNLSVIYEERGGGRVPIRTVGLLLLYLTEQHYLLPSKANLFHGKWLRKHIHDFNWPTVPMVG